MEGTLRRHGNIARRALPRHQRGVRSTDARRNRSCTANWISTKIVCRAAGEYAANAVDEQLLKMNPRTELKPCQVTNVFSYPRNLKEKYAIGRALGAGSFGVVRECTEIATGWRFAMKTIGKIPKRERLTPRYLMRVRNEVEVMEQLGYSLDAVNLKDVFEDDESVHLVMQLCEGGSLLDRVNGSQHSERYIVHILRSILRFLSQCHAKGVIYRDVKPENFLFQTRGDDSPLKATDFGLSIKHWPDEPKLKSRSGTPAYMAPEVMRQCYDEKSDVWSVGMLSYQLLTGRFPFWEDPCNGETMQSIIKTVMVQEIDWNADELQQLSAQAVDFLKCVLERDPEKRCSARKALEHPWICEECGAADKPLGGSVVQRLQRFSTYGGLKQMVLQMIVSAMPSDTCPLSSLDALLPQMQPLVPCSLLKDLRALFEQIDADGSGMISLSELSSGLRGMGYVLSDAEVQQLMRKVDSDNDGNVAVREFLATLVDWRQLRASQDWAVYVEHAFEKLDADGDGNITLDELLEHLPTVSVDGSPLCAEERLAEAKHMLREVDTNGDGHISKQEFYALLEEQLVSDSLSFYDDRLQNPGFVNSTGSVAQGPDPESGGTEESPVEQFFLSLFKPQIM